MRLYSTKNKNNFRSLKEAVLKGLPEDKGLFMPEEIPQLPPEFFQKLPQMSFPELAYEVSKCLLKGAIPDEELKAIIEQAINFDAPVHSLDEDKHILELFHGPSLAFKDFGARFMAQLMSYFVKHEGKKLYILVATSGDTGGAVASGFYQTEGIEVVILYPSGKVSLLQEKQLTTLGHNIQALEVDGTFDDCQALVKEAFLDKELNEEMRLSSANSINIARLIPQSFYYFRAWQQLRQNDKKVAFAVPSGNFGNLTAGLLAKRMGLPIDHFIAATNVNDIVPAYLASGEYSPRPSSPTISNAMDVGNPSNFERMRDLFGEDWEKMKAEISGFSYTDEETREAIQAVYDAYGYIIDPHAAVAYLAFHDFRKNNPNYQGVILGTAHPAKFLDVIEPVLDRKVPVPERLEILRDRKKESIEIGIGYPEFKSTLLSLL
ncbi:MAG: threonine synthase [Bacteroidia bacterium]|nr:threonine synthase [Bacteroidia bacterium]